MDVASRSSATVPGKSYMICAIPRTGSYLLCDMLSATGVAGKPNEYFSESYQRPWSRRWGINDYDTYLRRIVEIGTTSNGITGIKTHPWQFNYFARQAAERTPVPYVERPAILANGFPTFTTYGCDVGTGSARESRTRDACKPTSGGMRTANLSLTPRRDRKLSSTTSTSSLNQLLGS